MIDLPDTVVDIPLRALEAARAGRTAEAVRIFREATGVDFETAKARVDSALAISQEPPPSRSRVIVAVMDYLAGSMKFPLACALGAGAASLWAGGTFFPDAGKHIDSGLFMLLLLCVPMVVTAAWLMLWARRWKKMRTKEMLAVPATVAPARAKFAGLPDPGFPAAARGALDRGDTIAAVKIVREELGVGLADAKALVDAETARRTKAQ